MSLSSDMDEDDLLIEQELATALNVEDESDVFI
jgi:hypothetical protein